MQLSRDQIVTLSRYLSDISKILFASIVVGFFVPTSVGFVPLSVFLYGLAAALLSLMASLRLVK